MKHWLIVLFAGAVLGVATVASAAGDAKAGAKKAVTCQACHGPGGNSTSAQFPKLAGQHASYILSQLKAFKSGARKNPIMSGMAAPLSEQDMENLAAYFASQKPMQPDAADPKLAKAGEAIYRGGIASAGVPACMACHGPGGSGNGPAGYPRIGGQHAQYVQTQLENFKKGERSNDPNAMMRDIAGRLSDQQIKEVAAYVSGLYAVKP